MNDGHDNILARLKCKNNFELFNENLFPWLGYGFVYIDSRMKVFGTGKDWAVTIEVIVVNTHMPDLEACANSFYAWDTKSYIQLKKPDFFPIAFDGDDGPVFSDFELIKGAKTIKIRNHIVPIPQNDEIYANKRIDLIGGDITQYELLRALTPEYRDFFFLSDEEIYKKLNMDIPKLLQLEEWRHPVVYEDTTLESPAECEVFKLIAKVIETQDPTFYKPTEKPNTHWSNWILNDYL